MRTGLDRPGPGHFGPVLGPKNFHFWSSVRSRSGPVDRTKLMARSCCLARADRAPQKKEGGLNKMGGTGWPCPTKNRGGTGPVYALSMPGPVQDRSGPGFARSGPVLGPCLGPYSVFGPGRSGPVWDRITPLASLLLEFSLNKICCEHC